MGYCSDVGLCLTIQGVKALEEAKLTSTTENALNLVSFPDVKNKHESGAVAFFWASMKWYHIFEEVGFVNNFLATLDDEDYLFIRVGEDYDDVEVSGGFHENPFQMHTERQIIFAAGPYEERHIEAAQCIWEYVIEFDRIENINPLSRKAFEDLGIVEFRFRLRNHALLDACEKGFTLIEAFTENIAIQEAFIPYDWAYVPFFVENCIDWETVALLPNWRNILMEAVEAIRGS